MNFKFVRFLSISLILGYGIIACTPTKKENEELNNYLSSSQLHDWNEALEAAIVNDFFPPPVAGRIYTFPNIAAYEALVPNHENYISFTTLYPDLTIPKAQNENINAALASSYSFYFVAKDLVYDNEPLEEKLVQFEEKLDSLQVDMEELKASKAYGEQVAKAVQAWADKDGYKETRSYPKFQLKEGDGAWKPTPPDYMDAMEPYWNTLRPFTLDSASQFRAPDPPEFDMEDTNSEFYQNLMVAYRALLDNTEETKAIAKFWDCNPLVIKHQGHVTFAEKKLTPGGHWVNISRRIMKAKKTSLMETAYAYTMVTVGIHEAFISCWDTKYHTNYIRPVTVIQERIDKDWMPILYTPNFPEHTSGHSVVSRSAATILTHIFGDNYAFTDSTEVPYGMPPRSFESFLDASDEAAVSRVYGGIHYMPAVILGKEQGEKVGKHVLANLVLKK